MFHLALRQAEAFSRGALRQLGLTAPDRSTSSCGGRTFTGPQPRVQAGRGPIRLPRDSTGRELFGQGERDAETHGRRRQRRKLPPAVDAGTGEVAAPVPTKGHADDAAQVPALLGQAEGVVASGRQRRRAQTRATAASRARVTAASGTSSREARRFGNWENNYAARLGRGVAVDYAMSVGMKAIEARCRMLGARFGTRRGRCPASRSSTWGRTPAPP